MSDDRRYASVPERITWTTGFRVAIDKSILGTLSTFANFKTGAHADMWLDTLVKRAQVPRRTVIRSLRRLEDDGWITARRRHRHRTIYDINVDRLATHWMEAKLVEPLSATGGTQESDLSATGGTQGDDQLSDTGDRLSATGGTPRSPVREDPLFDHKEPALRAVPPDLSNASPPTSVASAAAKVQEAKEATRDAHQLTFGAIGPADGRAPPVRDPNWTQRFAETLRSALTGHTTDRKKHG